MMKKLFAKFIQWDELQMLAGVPSTAGTAGRVDSGPLQGSPRAMPTCPLCDWGQGDPEP